MTKALILLAHGSRDPSWSEPFEALASSLKIKHPQSRIELAFMELTEPSLTDMLNTLANAGQSEVDVLPIFFAAGRHLKRDVPAQIEAFNQTNQMSGRLREPVGAWPEVQETLANAIGEKLDL